MRIYFVLLLDDLCLCVLVQIYPPTYPSQWESIAKEIKFIFVFFTSLKKKLKELNVGRIKCAE
jgi:hypothetical protein